MEKYIWIAYIVAMVLAWRPLRRRFSWWGVVWSYFFFALSGAAADDAITKPSQHDDALLGSILFFIGGIAVLITHKLKPIEQREPTVTWMVVHGLWDQLAKEGLPADEIERLKRLTPEERAGLMASFKAPIKAKRHRKWEPDDDVDFYHGDMDQYRL